MQNLLMVGKNSCPILSRLCGRKFTNFGRVGDPFSFQCHCPIVYVIFQSEDLGR